jgi:hypothetical protein
MGQTNPFKWRHFEGEIILLCVRWYLRYALGYRDLEEMMRERGVSVDHTSIYRWVQHYAPELETRCRPHLNPGIMIPIVSTKPTSRSKVVGNTCTGRWTRLGTPSTFYFAPSAIRRPRRASSERH